MRPGSGCRMPRWQDDSVSAPLVHPLVPSVDERGLASWEPADLAGLVLPAWDEFTEIAAKVDLDAPSRVRGWSARDICIHLGSWPGARTLERMREEAARDDVKDEDPRAVKVRRMSHEVLCRQIATALSQ